MTNTVQTPQGNGCLKWLAIGCGGLTVLFLIVMGVLLYYGKQLVDTVTDPVKAEKTAKSIMKYEIPGGAKGVFSFDIQQVKIAMVSSKENPPDTVLFLAEIPEAKPDSPEKLRQELEKQSKEQREGNFKITDTKTENKDICDQTIPVTINSGTITNQNNTEIPAVQYQAAVNYKGNTRGVMLLVSGDESQTKAQTVFDSLDCE